MSAYDINHELIATKTYVGSYNGTIRGHRAMQRNLSKAVDRFLCEHHAHEVTIS